MTIFVQIVKTLEISAVSEFRVCMINLCPFQGEQNNHLC